jgi:hypothetical protein
VADARRWYTDQAGPPNTPAARGGAGPTAGPLPIDWAAATDTTADAQALVLAPIRSQKYGFTSSGYQAYRYLLVARTAPDQVHGVVVEVLLRGTRKPSRAAERALLARLYRHHQSPAATPPGDFTGYAFFYTVGYRYVTGTGYVKGKALPGQMRLTRATAATPKQGAAPGNKPAGCKLYLIKQSTDSSYYENICTDEPEFDDPNNFPSDPTYEPPYSGVPDTPTTPGNEPTGSDGSGGTAVTQIITDPSITNDEKANCIYTKLLNNPNFQSLLTAFRNSTQYNVRFALGNAGGNTGTTRWNYSTYTAEITIGADALGYQHAIWGATTFFHEAFHANLQQHAIATFGNFEISSWPKPINDMTLQELVTFVDASATKNQAWLTATHNFMASNIAVMADGLRIFVQNNYPATYAQIGNNPEAYKALALMGLQNSQSWTSYTTAQQQEYMRLMNEFVTSELPDCTK